MRTLETTIVKDWIDYNDHLNTAYYFVIFSQATEALQTHLGMTVDTIKETGFTLITIATPLRSLQEIRFGTNV